MRRLFLTACAFVFLASLPIGASWAQDEDCNGSDQRCPDGKYHDSQGKVQPDSCDNFKTGSAETHACACERATTCKHDALISAKCGTYCRPKACKCTKDCS
jgi:hypothetical protein